MKSFCWIPASPGLEARLTGRARQIIALICEGLDNRSIGLRLNLSTKTVRATSRP